MEKILDLLEHRHILAGTIAVGSVLAAYVTELFFRVVLTVLARRTRTEVDDQVIEALRRPIFLSVIFFGLAWSAETLRPPEVLHYIVFALFKTLAALVWAAALFKIGGAILEAFSRRSRIESVVQPRTLPAFDMLLKIAVVGAAIYFTFLAWDIDLTAWLASAGIIGIAVGFAAKDTLANLFSGIFILADAPYKVGDWIVLDNELRGKVTKIGVRSTRILTRDDIEITVPNAVIGGSKIVNEAGGPNTWQRVPIRVSCAYGSDVDEVRSVLYGCVEGEEGIRSDPPPEVRFRLFGGSGLEFELLVYVEDPARRGLVIDRLNTRVYKEFGKNGIEIPYSKHDLYIKEMPR